MVKEADLIKNENYQKTIALAGNPNVGKSTVFNGLTGMHQHTGNWPGKTVFNAFGYCHTQKYIYKIADLPGTYSILSHSEEETAARDFICFTKPDLCVIICDATCLERNLNLALQIMEIHSNVLICVNLLDEAKHKKIKINLRLLSKKLGVPVVGIIARQGKTLNALLSQIDHLMEHPTVDVRRTFQYSPVLEHAIGMLEPILEQKTRGHLKSRWLALKILENDPSLLSRIEKFLGNDLFFDPELSQSIAIARRYLDKQQITPQQLEDHIVNTIVSSAESIASACVTYTKENYNSFDLKMDRILTSKISGYPIMLILLLFIFWLTIAGANYPSQCLSIFFAFLQEKLSAFLLHLSVPQMIHDMICHGILQVSAWVIAVMLPPMAIFFPLFTLLEDIGYLPRIAYNLDKPFQCCNACGKQALTMAMGFGCNAAGVTGCRIIDSPRERLLAILTNNFVPCNGRFPALIALLTMFFSWSGSSVLNTFTSAIGMLFVILIGISTTFLVTKCLSLTLLKGVPSSFTLELPPYRKPQITRIIIHSLLNRTLFVLFRAIAVAAPAGLLIWIMANWTWNGISLLHLFSSFLDPFAQLIGLDGIILMGFILGFPANEIVIPIIIMGYLSTGSIVDINNITTMKHILLSNGWTFETALNTMILFLMHWPCSTTLLTIKKETKSIKWTFVSAALPTIIGISLCFFVHIFLKIC